MDEFDGLLDEEGKQIGMLNMIDDGFENVYSRVREELMANPEEYQEILREIQTLISEDVELGATLEALERKNKEAIEAFIQKKKEEVRTYRSNKNSSKNYTKNMPNQYVQGESFFLDQKK